MSLGRGCYKHLFCGEAAADATHGRDMIAVGADYDCAVEEVIHGVLKERQ